MNKSNIYRSLTIKDSVLNKRPGYYKSMSDNPSVGRFAGFESRENMIKIIQRAELKIELSAALGYGTGTYNHGLGYTPLVFGTYKIISIGAGGDSTKVGIRGMIPEERFYPGKTWQVYVAAVDNSNVTVSFYIDAALDGIVLAKLIILREKTVD